MASRSRSRASWPRPGRGHSRRRRRPAARALNPACTGSAEGPPAISLPRFDARRRIFHVAGVFKREGRPRRRSLGPAPCNWAPARQIERRSRPSSPALAKNGATAHSTTGRLDADDTLWHNESIFRLTQDAFRALMADVAAADVLDERLAAARMSETDPRLGGFALV